MSQMKTEPGWAGPPQRTPPQSCCGSAPPQGAVAHPDSGRSLSPRPPTQPRSEGYSGAEGSDGSPAPRSWEMLGKQLSPPGPSCGPDPPQALCEALFWFASFTQTQRRGPAGKQGRPHPCSRGNGDLVAGPPRLCGSPDGISRDMQ